MAKVLCVLYDDPVDGMPKKYARDDVPAITKYHDGQSAPTPKAIDFKPGELLGSVGGSAEFLFRFDEVVGWHHHDGCVAIGLCDQSGTKRDTGSGVATHWFADDLLRGHHPLELDRGFRPVSGQLHQRHPARLGGAHRGV